MLHCGSLKIKMLDTKSLCVCVCAVWCCTVALAEKKGGCWTTIVNFFFLKKKQQQASNLLDANLGHRHYV